MNSLALASPTLCRLRFAPAAEPAGAISFSFADPAPSQATGDAVPLNTPPPADSAALVPADLEILVGPAALRDDPRWRDGATAWLAAPAALTARHGEWQVAWCIGRAVLFAPPPLTAAALEAVVDFAHYEHELRRIERALTAAWPAVEADTPLAYDITKADVARDREIGRRARAVLQLRISLSRIEPHLSRPPARFPRAAAELGAALREGALCDVRAETASDQLEAQEYVYEMASQRLGEYRHARQGFVLETIIILLLAAEVVLLLLPFG